MKQKFKTVHSKAWHLWNQSSPDFYLHFNKCISCDRQYPKSINRCTDPNCGAKLRTKARTPAGRALRLKNAGRY